MKQLNNLTIMIYILSNIAMAGGSGSGGTESAYVEDAVIECAVNHKLFTAWEWQQENNFHQLKTLQIFNAYKDSTRTTFSHVGIKLITHIGTFTSRIDGKLPFTSSSLPLKVTAETPEETTLSLSFNSESPARLQGVLYSARSFGPVAIPLTNCGLPGTLQSIPEVLLPTSLFNGDMQFTKSTPNSSEFTNITLEKNQKNKFTIGIQTLLKKDSFGEDYVCTSDVYQGELWAIQCSTSDRRLIGGEKKEFILVSYDGKTFYAVTRVFTTLENGDAGELKVLEQGLRLNNIAE